MIYEHITLTSSSGAEIALDSYVPNDISDEMPTVPRLGIVICGGGGYAYVSERETEPVALRFAAMGINTYVVQYRVAPNRFPASLHDIGCAVAYVRQHAEHFVQHPDKIAVLGFSAGGHAAGTLGVMWHKEELWAPLQLTPEDVKPNAMVLCYPVITAGKEAHRGSFVNLTGSEDLKVQEKFSLQNLVTSDTPPTFLWSTWEDGAVPCQNTLLMALALKENDVPGEVHIYSHGQHGLSLGDRTTSKGISNLVNEEIRSWPELAANFLFTTLGE